MGPSFLLYKSKMYSRLLIGLILPLVHGQRILNIETKTADVDDAGMTLGSVNLDIFNSVPFACSINKLDGAGDDFQKGDINVFEGEELQECLLFEVPRHNITLLKLSHSGTDAWRCEWIRVIFDDNYYVQCNDGEEIDDDEVHNLSCGTPMQ